MFCLSHTTDVTRLAACSIATPHLNSVTSDSVRTRKQLMLFLNITVMIKDNLERFLRYKLSS